MKRDLEQMETIHNLYVGYKKQLLISDSLLLTWIFVAIVLNVSSVILTVKQGVTWLAAINLLLIGVNIYSTEITVVRMIETRRKVKAESRLYEEVRAEMVKFCEIEEAFGEEIELDFREELE